MGRDLLGKYANAAYSTQPCTNTYRNCFHSSTDVTTSPNDVGPFNGYHANLERNSFHWRMSTFDSLGEKMWLYPDSQENTKRREVAGNTYMSGPFAGKCS